MHSFKQMLLLLLVMPLLLVIGCSQLNFDSSGHQLTFVEGHGNGIDEGVLMKIAPRPANEDQMLTFLDDPAAMEQALEVYRRYLEQN